MYIEEKFKIGDAPKTYFSKTFEDVQIFIGSKTCKNRTAESCRPYRMTQQQIVAHKFKYGLSYPIRDQMYVQEKYDNYQYASVMGRHFLSPEKMYEPYYETHITVTFRQIKANNPMLRGKMNPDMIEFYNAVANLNQHVHNCGDLIIFSTRMLGTLKVSVDDNKFQNLIHQVALYKVDGVDYVPPPYDDDDGSPDFRLEICRKEWNKQEKKYNCKSVNTLF